MSSSRSSHAVPALAPSERTATGHDAPLHLVEPRAAWGADVALVTAEDLIAHPLSGRIPPMSPHERTALAADIAARGITTPLDVTSGRVILDGHARRAIARELGSPRCPCAPSIPTTRSPTSSPAPSPAGICRRPRRAALVVECDQYRAACAEGRLRKLANLHPSPDVATLPHRGGRTREIAADLAGVEPAHHPGRRMRARGRPRAL